MNRSELDQSVQAAVGLFEHAPIGQQLADYREREGRCWRSSTRFLSALRESGADGELLVWTGEGWEHGAIQLKGTDIVVDWTASQFEKDPDTPGIRTPPASAMRTRRHDTPPRSRSAAGTPRWSTGNPGEAHHEANETDRMERTRYALAR